MTTAPLLQLEDIKMNFGAIEALKGISFSVGKGEVVALLGDNGAGKSTLVKIISGGLLRSSGRMTFDGSDCGAFCKCQSIARRGAASFSHTSRNSAQAGKNSHEWRRRASLATSAGYSASRHV